MREAGEADGFAALSSHLAAWIPKQCARMEEEQLPGWKNTAGWTALDKARKGGGGEGGKLAG